MSLAHLGMGQLVMDSIFSGCFSIPSAETTKPQKSMGEDQAEMLLVVGLGAGVDDDVVNVDGAELVILLEEEIHGPLEGGGRIAEGKWHDAELEGAVARLEGGAFAVLGDDLDLVEPRPEVHFGEHSGTSHGV